MNNSNILKVIGIAAIMLLVGVAIGSIAFPVTSTKTYTETQTSPIYSSTSWQVLKTNVTINYFAACMVLNAVGHTCPTINTTSNDSTLAGVELVEYQGTKYYMGNFSEGPYLGYASFDANGYPTPASRIVWFMNSTIFCIDPPYGDYRACP